MDDLVAAGISSTQMMHFIGCLDSIEDSMMINRQNYQEGKESLQRFLSSGSRRILGSKYISIFLDFLAIVEMIYDGHIDDYRTILTHQTEEEKVTITWSFWCLNPGVIFRKMALESKSVILTSGTLSPLATFASELQTEFKYNLEASHVIDPSQVWIATIPQARTGDLFLGNFQNTETFKYQDQIGETIHEIICSVPHGVLCFVPSYSFLDKHIDRWKNTGLFKQLVERKKIFIEPRQASANEFETVLRDYRKAIKESVESKSRGALFFAVYRGKASEGIDFRDDNARAVISVGIPYPNM